VKHVWQHSVDLVVVLLLLSGQAVPPAVLPVTESAVC
jgi:hypothetical protein